MCLLAFFMASCAASPREETPAVPAEPPLTTRDVLDLHKSGLGSASLIALIETSQVAGPITRGELVSLKKDGLPDEVIAALIHATRTPPVEVRRVVVHRYEPTPFDRYWYWRHRWGW